MSFLKKNCQYKFHLLVSVRRAGGLSVYMMLTPGPFPRVKCTLSKTEAEVGDTFHGEDETASVCLAIPEGTLVSGITL